MNKALGLNQNQPQQGDQGQGNQGGDQPNMPTAEQLVEGAVGATIQQLRESGMLKVDTTTSNQPGDQQDGGNQAVNWSQINTNTAEGAKAFDEFIKANGKELIQIQQ